MKELIKQLSNISDAYDDFILGVMNYVKRDSSHVELLNSFLRDNSDITSSDVIAFIISQPDFHKYSAVNIEKKVIWIREHSALRASCKGSPKPSGGVFWGQDA